ncbi:MAG: VOC family protein [Hyphomicrobiaceae bacterium]|nr:MAG: VOC family protein [Hyphomicrobiaceae bacterium]
MFNIGKWEAGRPTARQDRPAIDRRRLMTTVAALAAGVVTSAAAPRAASASTTVQGSEVGAVWWTELQTTDVERARTFYSQTLGWTPKVVALEDMTRPPAQGEKEYTLFMADGREVAGATKIDETAAEGTTPSWLTYVQVANVDAAALRAVELGGKLLEPPVDVPNTGRIAVVQDAEGVRIGLIAPAVA